MHGAVDFPLLSMLVLVPAIGSLLVALSPRRRPEYAKLIATVTSVGVGAMSVWSGFGSACGYDSSQGFLTRKMAC